MTSLNRREALQAIAGTALAAALPLPALAAPLAAPTPIAFKSKLEFKYIRLITIKHPTALDGAINQFYVERVEFNNQELLDEAEAYWQKRFPKSEVVACIIDFKEACQPLGEKPLGEILLERYQGTEPKPAV